MKDRPGPRKIAQMFRNGESVYRIASRADIPLGDVESAVRLRLVQLEKRDRARGVAMARVLKATGLA